MAGHIHCRVEDPDNLQIIATSAKNYVVTKLCISPLHEVNPQLRLIGEALTKRRIRFQELQLVVNHIDVLL